MSTRRKDLNRIAGTYSYTTQLLHMRTCSKLISHSLRFFQVGVAHLVVDIISSYGHTEQPNSGFTVC